MHVRKLAAVRVRKPATIGAVLVLVAGLLSAVVMLTGAPRPGLPSQLTGTAADHPHRVAAAVTLGRLVNGRVVPVTPVQQLAKRTGKSWTARVPGAVGVTAPPRPLHFPIRGKGTETVHAVAAAAPAKITGYDSRTSRMLALSSATQVTYANADGTHTAVEYPTPVNYRRSNGTWASISTTLVPDGAASGTVSTAAFFTTPAPSAGSSSASASSSSPLASASSSPASPSASSSASPPPPPATASPSPSQSMPLPQAGWTEGSEARPETFAQYANMPQLVTVPLDASHVVAFGVAGAAAVPGVASGSSVSYANVRPDSTIRFTAGTSMVKEQIVLDSPAAPASWVFPLDLTGLHAQSGSGGIVEFADASGRVVAYVPPGFMSDSNIDPHSGDGATSWNVSYSLVTYGGRQAIKVTLDSAWLHSSARVFPVTVDPSVAVNSDGTTYVQYPDTNDFSGDTEIHVGTYDGGSDKAMSYLSFSAVATALKNDTVLGAQLALFNTWSYSCSPRPVYVYPVTSSWSITGNKSWPGPSTGAAIGRRSFAAGWVPYGSTISPCAARWEPIKLDQAATDLIDGWTHGTVADDGLAVGASTSDSYAWKKFASHVTGTGDPFLAITYTTDGASYALASRRPITPVESGQNGKFAIKVTNTGSSTWTPTNGYEISYRAYDSAGHKVADHPVFTAMPSTVAPGQTVTVDATVDALNPGAYSLDFDMYSAATGSSPVSFSSQGIAPYAVGLYIPQPPPTVTGVYPPPGFISTTLRQQLSVAASTASGTITYSFTLTCKPLAGQTCVKATIPSGSITKDYWTPPVADLQWNTPYQWSVTTTVSGASTTVSGISITMEALQPAITAGLGGTSGRAYDPLTGNYTTSATEAAVAGAGIPLAIARTYNSMDPRTTGAFGAGWSSVVDAALRPDNDGSASVLITTPAGKQLRFGQNGNGTYSPTFGSSDILVHNSAGTWTLRDSTDTQYTFTSAGVIAKITDPNGQSQVFTSNSTNEVTTITDPVSGRALTLTWVKQSGQSAHVTSVTIPALTPGQSGYTWTYNYSGDQLSSVCSPGQGCASCPTGCTAYSYTPGSDYLSSVLDSGPRTYWQLGEASGTTTAADEVDANLGTTDGTYHNVTLGVTGPLAGSSETAAGFNGTSSSVSLPNNLIAASTDEAIGLWFKGASSTASGVLFSYQAQPLSSATGNHEPVLYVGVNGKLYGEFWNGSVDPISTTTSVDDGKWHYVVLSASTSTQSMYLDGQQVGLALSGQIDNLNLPVDTIGAGYWASWPENTTTAVGYFAGDIGQVAVYMHPLSPLAAVAQHTLGATASAQLSQVTLASGNVYEQAKYDTATDRVESYTDPNGGRWAIGQPLATGYKSGSDGLGVVMEHIPVTDPAGRQATYSYDMLDGGRLVSYNNGADPPMAYGYDAAGFLTAATDQDGNLVCFTNDIHGNILTRTWYPGSTGGGIGGGIGITATCGGSTSSSATCTSSGAPCTTFYGYTTFDAANPLNPDNNLVAWVKDGRSASNADTTYQTSYTHNAVGQVTSKTTPPTSDFPSGRKTGYVYSAGTETAYGGSGTVPADLLLSVTTPGGAVTKYQYYSNGDLAQVTEPSGRSTVYTYDGVGRPLTSVVTTTTFPSETTNYAYNATNQLATVTYPAITNSVSTATHTLQDSYTYDSDGNVLSKTESDTTGTDAPRTTTYTYNDHGQVATETQPAGATAGGTPQTGGASSASPQGATTSYDYDAFGNVSAKTDPNGNVFRYSYNEYQKPTQVTLYTSSTAQAAPTASCSAPAVQDGDGGCDLVLASYGYDPAGLLASKTDAMGRTTTYSYDTDRELSTATTTDPSTSPTTGRQTGYYYDGAGNRIGQTVSAVSGGLLGTTTTTIDTVDAADRLASQVNDYGTATGDLNRSTAYDYDVDGHVIKQIVSTAVSGTNGTPPLGSSSVTEYGYDTAGNRTSQTVVDGTTSLETTWTYDQNGLPLSMTTPAGNATGATAASYTTNYAYDPNGKLATVTGVPAQTQTFAAQTPASTRPVSTYGYDTFGDQTQVTDPNGNTAVTGYDGDSRVSSVTQQPYTPPGATSPVGGTTGYAYDENGNRTQVTDPAGNVTQYAYDPLGDVLSVTEPQLPGQSVPGVWEYAYDANGEQLSAQDPLGNTTHKTYDYFGEPATTTDAMTNTTSYAYDYLGDTTKSTTQDGVVSSGTYDHLAELTSTADSYGNTTSYLYDYAGRRVRTTSPDTTYAQDGYDQAGQLVSVADYGVAGSGQAPQLRSSSFGYDPNGDLTSATDWNGNTAAYAYSAAGQLTSAVQPVSSAASITTSYGYDPGGNQTSVTGGNGNTTWTTFNAWNLPESVIEPATAAAPDAASRTWTTAYDADGRPAAVSQPGGITQSYAYDPLGDLTSKSGSGAAASTAAQALGYDLDGRLVSATAPGGTDAFTYNADSQVTGSSGPSGTSGYTYNGDGLVASETGPGGTASYTYDAAGRLATLADPLTGAALAYGYNADSQPASIGYSVGGASGPAQAFTYDGLHRVASDTLTSSAGAVLASETYGYDGNGNLTSQATAGLAGSTTTTYAYDQANRLTSSASGGTTSPYAYDSDGNLTQAAGTTYAYNAQDQVTSSTAAAGTTAYGYTLSGALSSVTAPGGTAQDYTADAFGELVSAPGGIGYGYDALGRLVTRTAGSAATSMSYLGAGSTLASDGTYSYSYTPGGALAASAVSGGTGYAAMGDVHGDLAASFSPTSSASTLAGSATYSPYGAVTGAGYQPGLGYQGNWTDPATGQVDLNARWYDPSTGSFATNDTVAGSPLPATADGNPYAYTAGDPLTETDPTGHYAGPAAVLAPAVGVGWAIAGPYGALLILGFGVGFGAGYEAASMLDSGGYAMPGNSFGPLMSAMGGWAAENQYALAAIQAAGGPALATVPSRSAAAGGTGGWIDPCALGCYAPPPPPPPPPDCYAGPHPTCTPAKAPQALRTAVTITRHVRDVTSYKPACSNACVRERLGRSRGPVIRADPGVNGGNLNDPVTVNVDDLIRPVSQLGAVPAPQAPVPADGGNITETAAGGGSNIHGGGGGGLPPTSNAGACEPQDNNGFFPWAEQSGILRDAAAGKGNFGLGSATAADAEALGQAWVGENFRIASDGKTVISENGQRQYWPPKNKLNLGKYQANFEQRVPGQVSNRWFSNGHLDIVDPPC